MTTGKDPMTVGVNQQKILSGLAAPEGDWELVWAGATMAWVQILNLGPPKRATYDD